MRATIVVFASLFAAFSAFAQTDAEFCAKVIKSNADDAKKGLPQFRLPDQCYPATTFDFTNKPSPQGLQVYLTMMRSALQLLHSSVDNETSTVTVQGSPDEIAMASWLVHELDQRVAPREVLRSDEYIVPASVLADPIGRPGKNDEVIRVFFLAHSVSNSALIELGTVLRVVGEVRTVVNDRDHGALVVRCPSDQMALAEDLINALDVVSGSGTSVQEFRYGENLVRVFYLTHVTDRTAAGQIVAALRMVTGTNNAFPFSPLAALAVRGSAEEIAAADWLIHSLDIPSDARPDPARGEREFRFAGNRSDSMMRVFYAPHATSGTDLQKELDLLHTKLAAVKASAFDAPPALVVRGSAGEIAEAEQLLQ